MRANRRKARPGDVELHLLRAGMRAPLVSRPDSNRKRLKPEAFFETQAGINRQNAF